MEKKKGEDTLGLDLKIDIVFQRVVIENLKQKKGILSKVDLYFARKELRQLETLLENWEKSNLPY